MENIKIFTAGKTKDAYGVGVGVFPVKDFTTRTISYLR
jgi:hypothetical protein